MALFVLAVLYVDIVTFFDETRRLETRDQPASSAGSGLGVQTQILACEFPLCTQVCARTGVEARQVRGRRKKAAARGSNWGKSFNHKLELTPALPPAFTNRLSRAAVLLCLPFQMQDVS
jgi:hypothetical protein